MSKGSSIEGPRSAGTCRTFQEFHDTGVISAPTLALARRLGFSVVSPVQEAVIPLMAQKRQDVAVEACTGSGKTLAFLVPCVEILLKVLREEPSRPASHCRVGALCLAPTRELAIQIHEVLLSYLECVAAFFASTSSAGNPKERPKLSGLVITGGYDIAKDIRTLCESETPWAQRTIIIATPGRLCTLINQLRLNTDWSFRELEVLIFDEADRLLLDQTSFETQLSAILAILPKQRRTGLFSATLSTELGRLVKAGMRNPLLIRVQTAVADTPLSSKPDSNAEPAQEGCAQRSDAAQQHTLPNGLSNFYCIISRHHKFAFLLKFLMAEIFPAPGRSGKKCILFFQTCAWANYFHKLLSELQACNEKALRTVALVRLFGKMSQKSRNAASRRFTQTPDNRGCILFATDIAARGLDFPDISWIVQYDAPTDPAMFVHRVGRTARAGRSGQSLLLLCPPEEAYIPFLQNRQVNIQDFRATVYGQSICDRTLQFKLSEQLHLPKLAEASAALQEYPEALQLEPESQWIAISEEDHRWAWMFCRATLMLDRDTTLKAAAAFVSFIRAYKEHHLQYIFPFTELEVGELASSLALLRIPRVKEILGKHIQGFVQSAVDPKSVPFKDKARELEWQKRQDLRQASRPKPNGPTSVAAGKTKQLHKRTRSDQRRAKKQREIEDVESLRLEERLFKKLRRGKITSAEYERRLKQSLKEVGKDGGDGMSSVDDDLSTGHNTDEASTDVDE